MAKDAARHGRTSIPDGVVLDLLRLEQHSESGASGSVEAAAIARSVGRRSEARRDTRPAAYARSITALMRFVMRAFLVCIVVVLSSGARALEKWPSQIVRIIVPFPAGGSTDPDRAGGRARSRCRVWPGLHCRESRGRGKHAWNRISREGAG